MWAPGDNGWVFFWHECFWSRQSLRGQHQNAWGLNELCIPLSCAWELPRLASCQQAREGGTLEWIHHPGTLPPSVACPARMLLPPLLATVSGELEPIPAARPREAGGETGSLSSGKWNRGNIREALQPGLQAWRKQSWSLLTLTALPVGAP